MALKAYTLGPNGFISPDIRDALGLPRHIDQASVTPVAASKRAAAELLASTPGLSYVPPGNPDFRISVSTADRVLAEAGLMDEAGILVTAMTGHRGNNSVVRIATDGTITTVGYLTFESGRWTFTPVQP